MRSFFLGPRKGVSDSYWLKAHPVPLVALALGSCISQPQKTVSPIMSNQGMRSWVLFLGWALCYWVFTSRISCNYTFVRGFSYTVLKTNTLLLIIGSSLTKSLVKTDVMSLSLLAFSCIRVVRLSKKYICVFAYKQMKMPYICPI